MSECPHVLPRYLAETNNEVVTVGINVFTYVFSLSPVRTLTHHPAVVCSAAVMSRVVGTGWWDLGPRAHQLWSEAEESEPVTKQKASLASALLTARQGPAGADAGAVRLAHRRRSPQRHLRGGQRSGGQRSEDRWACPRSATCSAARHSATILRLAYSP